MARVRSTVRSAIFLIFFIGCAFSLLAHPAPGEYDEETARAELSAAKASLRALLNTEARGATATYAALGLRNGTAVQAFYARHEYAAHWIQEAGWNEPAQRALAVLGRAAEMGLNRNHYAWGSLRALPDSLQLTRARSRSQLLALAELRLTDALLQYLQHVQLGRLTPHTTALSPPPDSARSTRLAEQLDAVLQAPSLPAAVQQLQPATRGYQLLQAAWARALQTSAADSVRLMQDTVAGFGRVAVNLERLRWEAPVDSEYAVVNIPAYRLQLVRNGQVVRTHRVVVGKPEWPTPVLSGRIVVFVTAPEWRVPYSIAVQEFLPELQQDPGFLYDHHYRLYDWRGRLQNPWRVNWQKVTPGKFPYTIRQRAGAFNALGNVVFYFPNQQTVFLHDTPARSAFTRPDRALSHGCVRVEKPLELAEYLLRREGRAKELTALYQSVRSHDKQRFDLQRSLPIYLRYYTCETDKGKLVFLPDIYHQDAAIQLALQK
ncbi:murein L,D-transpeptidase YcbB/YkuD [Hymenobacter sp. UYP22]